MAMVSNSDAADDLTFRERTVHKTLDDHDTRITKNERRWLVAKGALAMLAAAEGTSFVTSQLSSLI
jgi:hypothetical protein